MISFGILLFKLFLCEPFIYCEFTQIKLALFMNYSSLIENFSLNFTLDIPIRIELKKPFHTAPLFLLIVIYVCKA